MPRFRYTLQSTEKWLSGDRSKYIMRPHEVIEAGYHQVWYTLPGSRVATVNSRLAYLHHYRQCNPVWRNHQPIRLRRRKAKNGRHQRRRRMQDPSNRLRWTNVSYMTAYENVLLKSNVIGLWKNLQ